MAQGLKALHRDEFDQAVQFFTKATLHSKRDPYLCRAITLIRFGLRDFLKPVQMIKSLKDAKRDLNKAIGDGKDTNILYLRSLANFGLNYFYDSIVDIEQAIEENDEAQAEYYL
jgi:hypothetical protein